MTSLSDIRGAPIIWLKSMPKWKKTTYFCFNWGTAGIGIKRHFLAGIVAQTQNYRPTTGLDPQFMHTKNNSETNWKGYDNFETSLGKFSARRI